MGAPLTSNCGYQGAKTETIWALFFGPPKKGAVE